MTPCRYSDTAVPSSSPSRTRTEQAAKDGQRARVDAHDELIPRRRGTDPSDIQVRSPWVNHTNPARRQCCHGVGIGVRAHVMGLVDQVVQHGGESWGRGTELHGGAEAPVGEHADGDAGGDGGVGQVGALAEPLEGRVEAAAA